MSVALPQQSSKPQMRVNICKEYRGYSHHETKCYAYKHATQNAVEKVGQVQMDSLN